LFWKRARIVLEVALILHQGAEDGGGVALEEVVVAER